MHPRFRLFQRASGVFYIEDTTNLRQESLRTKDKHAAHRLWSARNEAHQQPALNLQLARAYLSGSDPLAVQRTWRTAMDAIVQGKTGPTRARWDRAIKDRAFDTIRDLPLLKTRAEDLLAVLKNGTVATNVYLRRLHNCVVDLNWIAWPLLPKRQWPAVRYGPKRAIRFDEHFAILDRERNPERRAFYDLLWHLGGSQGDVANLDAESIDWEHRTIRYRRQKTGQVALLNFGDAVAKLLEARPQAGPLFPYLRGLRASDRATEFKQRCSLLGISGVTLHSYRYAWAERAKQCGYPERFAMEALGHNSAAVHRAYARNAQVQLPALEEYERRTRRRKIVKVRFPSPLAESVAGIDATAPASGR